MTRSAFLLLLSVLPMAAQLPDFYKSVDRIIWVVDDIDKTTAEWKKMGLIETRSNGDIEFARWDVARFGDTIVDFIQPTGSSVFQDFKRKHGEGIMALLHRVPSMAALNQEVARMEKLGVKVIGGGPIDDYGAEYVLFDTEAGGKYTLGLIYAPEGEYSGVLAAPAVKPGARKVTQYAFAIKDMDAVSKYWERLGWPAMPVTDPGGGPDRVYRGKPGEYQMKLGWHRQGRVPYEWILSTKGPNVYEDHMAKRGEGVHHLAFGVEDMDKDVELWEKAGFPVSQAGSWGEKGKPGSGRYTYLDTQKAGGIDIELLWNYKAK